MRPSCVLHCTVTLKTHRQPRRYNTIVFVGMSLRNGEPRCLSLRRGFLFLSWPFTRQASLVPSRVSKRNDLTGGTWGYYLLEFSKQIQKVETDETQEEIEDDSPDCEYEVGKGCGPHCLPKAAL